MPLGGAFRCAAGLAGLGCSAICRLPVVALGRTFRCAAGLAGLGRSAICFLPVVALGGAFYCAAGLTGLGRSAICRLPVVPLGGAFRCAAGLAGLGRSAICCLPVVALGSHLIGHIRIPTAAGMRCIARIRAGGLCHLGFIGMSVPQRRDRNALGFPAGDAGVKLFTRCFFRGFHRHRARIPAVVLRISLYRAAGGAGLGCSTSRIHPSMLMGRLGWNCCRLRGHRSRLGFMRICRSLPLCRSRFRWYSLIVAACAQNQQQRQQHQ